MKKSSIYILFLFPLIVSCKNIAVEEGETCSIKVSDVEFTKSFNNADSLTTLSDEKLVINANAKTDYFNEPDGTASYSNAPLLLLKIDNSKPFTFTSQVTPTFSDTYDAGAMYIYINKTHWFKFAFERDEAKRTRIVTVRTIETSDDNNHDAIESASVYMKISSDTKTIGFYYSLDNETWQLVRLFKNDYPTELWTGLSAQSPVGNGTRVTFENCTLTQKSVKDFRMGI